MKRLLLLLLIPTLSYSQITFEDIMSINSEKTFKRVMIENGFEKEEINNENRILYGLDIKRDSVKNSRSSFWGGYYKRNGEFRFQISLSNKNFFGIEIDDEDNVYDLIVEKIKKNCKYYDIIEEGGDDYVCYSCSQSKYIGKIGFTKSEGNGYIKHIIPKKSITYNDIMSINSVDTYNKVVVKNGYDFGNENDTTIVYVIGVTKDSLGEYYSNEYIEYDKTDDWFRVRFDVDKGNDTYNILIDEIKNNCTFYDTLKKDEWTYDYLGYSCPQSTYKGKISYVITDSISYITHHPIEKE